MKSSGDGTDNDSGQDGDERNEEDAKPQTGIGRSLVDDPVGTGRHASHANAAGKIDRLARMRDKFSVDDRNRALLSVRTFVSTSIIPIVDKGKTPKTKEDKEYR